MHYLIKEEPFISHLLSRAEEAKDIGLLSKKDDLILSSAAVFFPDGIDKQAIKVILPTFPLREIKEMEKSHGWIKRDDLFDEAAKWILIKYSGVGNAELFCESGYSRKEDKILESRQHIIFRGNPFFNKRLSESNYEMIAKILRWGRSWRLLGVVADMSGGAVFEKNILFICDVFDGDSILVSEINTIK